jgi:hypothetical protein
MMSHPPIPIAELAEHTDLLKANDNLKLSQEYEVSGLVSGEVEWCRGMFSLDADLGSVGCFSN